MAIIRMADFMGMIPIKDVRTLPEMAASVATNARVDKTGTLRAINTPTDLSRNLSGTTGRIYRIPTSSDVSNVSSGYFWQHTHPDTDIVRTPLVNDSHKRYYWCNPTDGLRYAPEAMIIAATGSYKLGVVAPTQRVAISPTGGATLNGLNTGQRVTRSYTYTLETIYGEESQPADPVEMSGYHDQTWTITQLPTSFTLDGGAAIKHKNLYRTVTGGSGATLFFKVAEIPPADNTYNDTKDDGEVGAALELQSTSWAPPPAGIKGIAAMPNGIIVGFKDNSLYFSENYRPHAWPEEYMITVEYPIVGLGVFGNSVIVCTTGNPAVVSGTNSAAMALHQINAPMPCLSRQSIVSAPEGVIWASIDGLVMYRPSGFVEITKDVVGRHKWNELFRPKKIGGALVDGAYIGMYWDEAGGAYKDGFILSGSAGGQSGITYITLPGTAGIRAISDVWSGELLFIRNQKTYLWSPLSGSPMTYTWISKEFQLPKLINLSCIQAFFDETVSNGVEVLVKIYAYLRNDAGLTKVLVAERTFTFQGQIHRLPDGYKSDSWQFEVTGTSPLRNLSAATTLAELTNV